MTLTPEEWAERLNKRVTEVVRGKVLFTAVSNLVGSFMSKRIFIEGRDTSMGRHQYENTKPINLPNTRIPKGVNSGKTGRAEKTSYFTSYKAYKDVLNLGSGGAFVNWRESDELNFDFSTKVFQIGGNEVGTGVANPENAKKIEWLENKYGTIFQPTQSERKKLNEIIANEINDILTK